MNYCYYLYYYLNEERLYNKDFSGSIFYLDNLSFFYFFLFNDIYYITNIFNKFNYEMDFIFKFFFVIF